MTPEWSLASALVGSVVGGFVVHLLTLRRDTRTESRRLRVELLIRAYRTMVTTANHGSATKADAEALTLALNDLMLLGRPEQVELVQLLMIQGAEDGGTFHFTPLLLSLRDDLRRELGLAGIDFEEDEIKFFDFAPPDRPRRGPAKHPSRNVNLDKGLISRAPDL